MAYTPFDQKPPTKEEWEESRLFQLETNVSLMDGELGDVKRENKALRQKVERLEQLIGDEIGVA